MKKLFSALISLSLALSGSAVFAQDRYPDPETISDADYRMPLGEIDFDSPSEVMAAYDVIQSVAGGVMNYKPRGSENVAYLVPPKTMDTGEVKQVMLRMKIPVPASYVQFYFGKGTYIPGDSRSVKVEDLTPSDGYQDLCIDTATVENWTDTVGLVGVSVGGGRSVVNKQFAIDFVRFSGDYYPALEDTDRALLYDFKGKDTGLSAGAGLSDVLDDGQGALWARTDGGSDAALTADLEGKEPGAAEIPRIRISLDRQGSGAQGKLYFITDSHPAYSEEASYSFNLQAGQTEYTVNTEENPLWTGKIKEIRILPSNGAGTVKMDYIRLDKFPCAITVRDGVVSVSGNLYNTANANLSLSVKKVQDGQTCHSASLKTDAQGNFSTEFSIADAPEDSPTDYELVFTGDQITGSYTRRIAYTTASYAEKCLENLNQIRLKGTAEQLRRAIEENYSLLYLQAEKYEEFTAAGEHLSQLYAALMGGQAADQAELSRQLNQAAVMLEIRYGTAEAFLAEFDEYDSCMDFKGLSAYGTYAAADKTVRKEAAAKMIAVNCATAEQMRSAFNESVVLAAVHHAIAWGDVQKILRENAELAGIDLSAAESLKSPSAAYGALTEKDFASLADLKRAYENAVAAQAAQENASANEPGNPGGGGGGFGRGGAAAGGTGGYTTSPPQADLPGTGESDPGTRPEQAGTFTDMAGFDWAKEAVEMLSAKGIVNGTGGGLFEPGREVHREEFAKMFVLALNLPLTDRVEFADMAAEDWCVPYVGAAVQAGLVRGMGDVFGVGQPITRQDAAVMAARALRMEEETQDLNFTDSAEVADYARSAVSALSRAGIIQGVGDGSFRPNGILTRAEAAVVLQRILGGMSE